MSTTRRVQPSSSSTTTGGGKCPLDDRRLQGIAALIGAVALGKLALSMKRRAAAKRVAAARDVRLKSQKPGVVYLFMFPRGPDYYCVSPYCVMIETYLRLCSIPHEVITDCDMSVSPTERFPYIELNGEGTADSDSIVKRLQAVFPEKTGDLAGDLDGALGTILTRYLTHSFKLPMVRHVWVNHPEVPSERIARLIPLPGFVVRRITTSIRKGNIQMLNSEGYGDLSEAEFEKQFLEDIQAVETVLSRWEVRDPERRIALTKHTIAAFFALLYYLASMPECAFHTPAMQHLRKSKPINKFMAHIESTYYPDRDKLLPNAPPKYYMRAE